LPTPFVASDCLKNCEYGMFIDAFKLILHWQEIVNIF
jgi:hypothetical protein